MQARDNIESTPPISLRNYLFPKNAHNKKYENITYTLRGRDAISLAIKHFGLNKDDRVLMPGYLCKIIIDPFVENFTPEFYDVEKDLSIDSGKIEEILKTKKIKVLYIIHYYGFLHKNLNELAELCKKYEVFLWEDHAHSALSDFNYNNADAMIFSFRKLFPIPDGGGLWIRNLSQMKIENKSTITSNVIAMMIYAKRTKLGMNKNIRKRINPMIVSTGSSVPAGAIKITPRVISFMSKRFIKSVDIEREKSIRKDIYKKWQNLFSGSGFKVVFESLPDNVCPYSLPIWTCNSSELLSKLWQNNVFIRNQWPLDEKIQEKCPVSYDISKSLFSLPIYPGLLQADMEKILMLVKRYGKPVR